MPCICIIHHDKFLVRPNCAAPLRYCCTHLSVYLIFLINPKIVWCIAHQKIVKVTLEMWFCPSSNPNTKSVQFCTISNYNKLPILTQYPVHLVFCIILFYNLICKRHKLKTVLTRLQDY